MRPLACAFLSLLLPLSSVASAESTRFHSYEGFGTFLEGDAKSTTLSSDGQVSLAPPVDTIYSESDGRIAASAAGNGRVFLAFAEGRIIAIDDAGKKTEYGSVPKGVVTALGAGANVLYVATMAPTKLYQLRHPTSPTAPRAKDSFEAIDVPQVGKPLHDIGAIWGIAESKKGLLIATGAPGSLYRREGGKFVELFKSSEEALRSLAVDDKGTIHVGGGSKGILYRGSDLAAGDKGGFVAVYDTGLDELTQIAPQASGEVFVIGLSGVSSRGGGSGQLGDAKGEKVAEKGKIRAQLVRVDAEGFAEVLAGSDDEILYDVSVGSDGRVLVATGSVDKENLRGRVYSTVVKTREISLVYQTRSAQVVRLLPRKSGRLALVTSDAPAIESFNPGFAKEGEFTLPVFDALTQSRFGSVQLEGDVPSKTEIVVRLRTGQTQTPDDTWSKWTRDIAVGIGMPDLPAGRFVQAKLLLRGDGSKSPSARRVRIAYARQNLAPYVGEVTLLPKGVALQSLAVDSVRERTVVMNEKGIQELKRAAEPVPGEGSAKAKQTLSGGALTVAWNAQDPNGDELSFDLFFRSASDATFRLLKSNLKTPFHTFEAGSLADGRYQFRVVAKDDESNPPGWSKHDSRDSLWFAVDNAPPVLSKLAASKKVVSFVASDRQSLVVKAEFSVDGSPLRPLVSRDGLLDSNNEEFQLNLGSTGDGSHVATVRVEDEAGNIGLGEVRF